MSCSKVTWQVSQPSACRAERHRFPVPSCAQRRLSSESSFTSGTSTVRAAPSSETHPEAASLGPTLEVGRSHHPGGEVQEPRGADLGDTEFLEAALKASEDTLKGTAPRGPGAPTKTFRPGARPPLQNSAASSST